MLQTKVIEIKGEEDRVITFELPFEIIPQGLKFFGSHNHKNENRERVENVVHSSTSPIEGSQGWEASEHKYIGKKAFMEFCQGVKMEEVDLLDKFEEYGLFNIGNEAICLSKFIIKDKDSEWCDLFLMCDIKEIKDNNLYLSIEENDEETKLLYGTKKINGEIVNGILKNTEIEQECFSRIVAAIKQQNLQTMSRKDKEEVLKVTSERGHTHSEAEINIELTPGDIVALAGDFSGVVDEPISFGEDEEMKKRRFLAAYLSLAAPKEKDKFRNLVKQIDEEFKAINEGLKKGLKPSFALEKVSDENNRKYGTITRYTYFPGTYFYSEYLSLAAMNFDHFKEDAREAYRIGHLTAMNTAMEANKEKEEKRQLELLMLAFTQELYACHFLTDLFSAGHIRTLRRELWEYTRDNTWVPGQYGKKGIAGLLAKLMHDEDNHNGLHVIRPKDGKKWKAYGDKCYFNPENNDNRAIVLETVQAALEEVYNAFILGNIKTEIYKYIPEVEKDANNKDINFAPLFRLSHDGQTIQFRKDFCNPHKKEDDCDYTDLKDFVKTYRHLSKNPDPSNAMPPDEKAKLKSELEDFVKEDDPENRLHCTIS